MDVITLATVSLFIPAILSLTWVFSYWFRKKNHTQRALFRLLVLAVPYYVAFAFYIAPRTNYRWMCALDIVCEPLVLVIAAGIIVYLYHHYTGHGLSRPLKWLLMLPPVLQAATQWTLYARIGFSKIVALTETYDMAVTENPDVRLQGYFLPPYDDSLFHYFHFVDVIQIVVLTALMCLIILVLCVLVLWRYGYRPGYFLRFWFAGHPTCTARANAILFMLLIVVESPLIITGRTMIMNNPALGFTMSVSLGVLIYTIAYVETFSQLENYSLKQVLNMELPSDDELFAGTDGHVPLGRAHAMATGTSTEPRGETPQPALSPADVVLAQKLRQIIDEDRIFMRHGLVIEDIADVLGTNRTKVSGLVQHVYGCSFRDLINMRRVEVAKEYLLNHPEATNEDIAWRSGYGDPSTFFRNFKELTGLTPRQWLQQERRA